MLAPVLGRFTPQCLTRFLHGLFKFLNHAVQKHWTKCGVYVNFCLREAGYVKRNWAGCVLGWSGVRAA